MGSRGILNVIIMFFPNQMLEDESARFDGERHLEWRRMRLSKSHSEGAMPLGDEVPDPQEGC